MLGQRLWRWPNIEPALGERLLRGGVWCVYRSLIQSASLVSGLNQCDSPYYRGQFSEITCPIHRSLIGHDRCLHQLNQKPAISVSQFAIILHWLLPMSTLLELRTGLKYLQIPITWCLFKESSSILSPHFTYRVDHRSCSLLLKKRLSISTKMDHSLSLLPTESQLSIDTSSI